MGEVSEGPAWTITINDHKATVRNDDMCDWATICYVIIIGGSYGATLLGFLDRWVIDSM